jgi:hypothetical protein
MEWKPEKQAIVVEIANKKIIIKNISEEISRDKKTSMI